jgi:hypothetical protein
VALVCAVAAAVACAVGTTETDANPFSTEPSEMSNKEKHMSTIDFNGSDPIDGAGGDTHRRAMEALAAVGLPANETNYIAAIEAVEAVTASRSRAAVDDLDDLGRRLDTADAISQLAVARLAERGLADDAEAFIDEYERITDEFNLSI